MKFHASGVAVKVMQPALQRAGASAFVLRPVINAATGALVAIQSVRKQTM